MKSHSKQERHLDTSVGKGQSRAVLWTGYSAKAAADLVNLTESTVRACVRDGLLNQGSDSFPLSLSFQDLSLLRTVKKLSASGLSTKRIRRQLQVFKNDRASEQRLCALAFDTHAGQVVVRNEGQSWHAESGQMVFTFTFDHGTTNEKDITSLADKIEEASEVSAGEWLSRAIALEESDLRGALVAYEKVLEVRPDSTEALVNKGRIHADMGDIDKAALCFRRALDVDPDDPTVVYNLGVIAQDIGKDDEAITLYQRSLELDENLAEAHYNLATIYDRVGETQIAIRHIHAYRKLTRS